MQIKNYYCCTSSRSILWRSGAVTAHGRKWKELVAPKMFSHSKFVKAYGFTVQSKYGIGYLMGGKGKEIINYDGKVCMMENERKENERKENGVGVRLDYTVPNTR